MRVINDISSDAAFLRHLTDQSFAHLERRMMDIFFLSQVEDLLAKDNLRTSYQRHRSWSDSTNREGLVHESRLTERPVTYSEKKQRFWKQSVSLSCHHQSQGHPSSHQSGRVKTTTVRTDETRYSYTQAFGINAVFMNLWWVPADPTNRSWFPHIVRQSTSSEKTNVFNWWDSSTRRTTPCNTGIRTEDNDQRTFSLRNDSDKRSHSKDERRWTRSPWQTRRVRCRNQRSREGTADHIHTKRSDTVDWISTDTEQRRSRRRCRWIASAVSGSIRWRISTQIRCSRDTFRDWRCRVSIRNQIWWLTWFRSSW